MFAKPDNFEVSEQQEKKDIDPVDSSNNFEKQEEAAENRNHRKTINEMVEWVEARNEGIEKEKPEGFEEIPGSEFLKRTPEELSTLFLIDGVIDFHGNEDARQYIGAGDLLSFEQKFVKIDGVVGKRSSFNGKVGYLTKEGDYLPIYGGEDITLEVSEKEQQGFEEVPELSMEDEQQSKDDFLEKVQREEKALVEMRQEMNELLIGQGLSMDEIENLSSEELFKRAGRMLAQKVEATYGVPWEVCLAQSSLESNFGSRALGKNFFGIKAMKNYQGETQEFLTTEYFDERKEVATRMVDKFRAYDSMADSFNDYGRFLANNSRYRVAFQYKNNPRAFLETVIASGYATDPNYVSKAEQKLGMLGYSLDKRHK
ncbi:glucosaminidase domain-containing protein [Candidatus Gracilibacteria bacterium]|nr:glucosaminidase domain-containing protein [Candidatus Gracilibacteria bacterium]